MSKPDTTERTSPSPRRDLRPSLEAFGQFDLSPRAMSRDVAPSARTTPTAEPISPGTGTDPIRVTNTH